MPGAKASRSPNRQRRNLLNLFTPTLTTANVTRELLRNDDPCLTPGTKIGGRVDAPCRCCSKRHWKASPIHDFAKAASGSASDETVQKRQTLRRAEQTTGTNQDRIRPCAANRNALGKTGQKRNHAQEVENRGVRTSIGRSVPNPVCLLACSPDKQKSRIWGLARGPASLRAQELAARRDQLVTRGNNQQPRRRVPPLVDGQPKVCLAAWPVRV